MTKFTVVLLFAILGSVYGRSTWDRLYSTENQADDAETYKSACSKQDDTICTKYPDSKCETSVKFRDICPRKCGGCVPFTGNCPSNYPYGCCWNGDEATDTDKRNCQDCEDRSGICQNEAIIADCDQQENTESTRKLCPITCGACNDYGN